MLLQLRELQANHSFWENSLFRAFNKGNLSLSDLQFVFGQYSFYSRNFTRYLAGFMAKGQGTVWIDQKQFDVEIGDLVFIPRWSVHQVKNTGDSLLVILAITDFGLTSKAFVGNYLKTARMQMTQDADYIHLSS